MRALLNGEEGSSLSLFKGADQSINVMVLNDDGTIPSGLASDTIVMEVYPDAQRRNAVVATHSCVEAVVAAGLYTLAFSAAAMTYGPGVYYGFIKRTTDGGSPVVTYGQKYAVITVR